VQASGGLSNLRGSMLARERRARYQMLGQVLLAVIALSGGILIELTGPGVDRTQVVRLFATGYGVPLTVTVAVL